MLIRMGTALLMVLGLFRLWPHRRTVQSGCLQVPIFSRLKSQPIRKSAPMAGGSPMSGDPAM